MECPVCYEDYSAERPAESPGNECRHSACRGCWIGIAERDYPVRCPVCRHDVTEWFLEDIADMGPPLHRTERMSRERRYAAAHGVYIRIPEMPVELDEHEFSPAAHRVREVLRAYISTVRERIHGLRQLATEQLARNARVEVEWTRRAARMAFEEAENISVPIAVAEDAARHLEAIQNPLLQMMRRELTEKSVEVLLAATARVEDILALIRDNAEDGESDDCEEAGSEDSEMDEDSEEM